jgi:hypothetical protein
MRKGLSIIAIIVIALVMLQYRMWHITPERPLNITQWDAFGYYMYLPATVIYKDYKQLDWLTEIDKRYHVTGGDGWQADKLENGNYVFKYLGGVAIMQLPLFLLAHTIAKHSHYPPDGFSPPYQYVVSFGVILYCVLALFLLRRILLRYFSDLTVAITLLLLCLASNILQYIPVDNGLSHAYIFVLYVVVLFSTIKWHEKPGLLWAALTGYTIGLATISRPTEAVMLFIPLLWSTHTKEAAREKWDLVKQNKTHLMAAVISGLLGILPQLTYWKLTTGSFIYDVGSKWDFLTPHLRVLFGWEKGWFIYTPVTILFIVGMFFLKRFPFQKSVLWFCLLNIWIIIAWHEWRYAASYSTRALVQSYPVFALPLAAVTERIISSKWRLLFYPLTAYLIFVNMFQVPQYWSTVLHYDEMNRRYYSHIYLNPYPTPLDISLLDNEEILNSEKGFELNGIAEIKDQHISFSPGASVIMEQDIETNKPNSWLKIEAEIKAPNSLWQSYLKAELQSEDSIKTTRVRLFSPISSNEKTNSYMFYMSIPPQFQHSHLKVLLTSPYNFEGMMKKLTIIQLEK